MITKKHIVNISPTLFLNSLPSEKHSEAQAMFNDQAVDHIVLLMENDGDVRHLVSIGKNSEYKDISTITIDFIEGMHAIAFVDAHQAFPDLVKIHEPRQHTPTTQATKPKNSCYQPHKTTTPPNDPPNSHQSIQFESLNSQLEAQIKELRRTLSEVRGEMMLKDQTVIELNNRIKQLEQSSCEPESDVVVESVLIDRENSVVKAEEELIKRLTHLMEKEAELEQYEENLAGRESLLNERSTPPDPCAPATV